MTARALSIAVVTYRPDRAIFERSMASVARAVHAAREAGRVSRATAYVIDNGEDDPSPIAAAAASLANEAGLEVLHGHGNVGYGRANNLVLARLDSDLHLVINPDVELEPDSLVAAIDALERDPGLGAVAPAVRGPDGERQYLCKRYPTVWVLFLRGFVPRALRAPFSRSLDRYEMRDLPQDVPSPVPLASGCFMLMRTELFRRARGFDPRFFLYFEDYDLSLRLGREAQVAYVPAARIVHHGGEASRKGLRHIGMFVRSAWRFFATHGWKIA
jgi:GT2 family glycosyltransferase